MSGAVAIPRFTPNLPLKSTYFPQVNRIPAVNSPLGVQNKEISRFTVASNGLLIRNNNPVEDTSGENNIEVTQETPGAQSVVIQTRPQSYDKYIKDIHDERDLIPKGKKTVLIIDVEREDDNIETIKEERITPSRQWLLNQRQGDETDRIAERDPVPIAPRVIDFSSSLAGNAYNQLPDLRPYRDNSNDGEDYLRSQEYEMNQMVEESIKPKSSQSYPGSRNPRLLSQQLPIVKGITQLHSQRDLQSQIKSAPTKMSQYKLPQSLYQVDIPELTMPQEFLQTGPEPLPGPNSVPVLTMPHRTTSSGINISTINTTQIRVPRINSPIFDIQAFNIPSINTPGINIPASSQALLSQQVTSQPNIFRGMSQVSQGFKQGGIQGIPQGISQVSQGLQYAGIKGIPQINLGPIPAPVTTTSATPQPQGMLATKSQVGMSESLLQMNIPSFLQNNIGSNASWI